jgi:CRISPR-associated protein Cpf1
MTNSLFSPFIKQFAVQRTLRFELLPVGETKNKMKENLQYDETLKTFLKDQEIEDAYQTLKPIFDKIHEEFITKSLESDEAKNISFSKYLELRKTLIELKKKKNNLDKRTQKQEIKKIESEINALEKDT